MSLEGSANTDSQDTFSSNWPLVDGLSEYLPSDETPRTAAPPPVAKQLDELIRPDFDDLNELLQWRYLCRGAGMLLVGPTGIGKSSLAMQLMMNWALAQPAFDIRPALPLKSLLIQAENDEGDLAEMRDGVARGLELSRDVMDFVNEKVMVAHEDSRTGQKFADEVCRPLLEQHRPDLLWIDPVLAYLGGEANSQKEVGNFLRNLLNPLLREFECGGILIHHTNKPPTGKEKSTWKGGDFAYLGSGSAEWSNWPRAVLAVRSTVSHSVFELVAGKRGGRLRWTESDGTTVSRVFSKFIVHAKEPGTIFWREADPSERPVPEDEKADPRQIVIQCFPKEDEEIPKNTILRSANITGLGKNKIHETIKELIADGTILRVEKPRKGNRREIFLVRTSKPPPKE